jgi:hypothetical protein
VAGLIEDYALTGDLQPELTFSAGERVPFVLRWMPSHEDGPGRAGALDALAGTGRFWRHWAARRTYQGLPREAVMRSLITLKALTGEPVGGIVAAAPTSLPEGTGGIRRLAGRKPSPAGRGHR